MYANAVEVWSQPPLSSTGPFGGVNNSPVCGSTTWSDKAVSAGQRITSIVVNTATFNGLVAVCGLQAFYGGSTAGAANNVCSGTGWSGSITTTT